MPSLQSTHRADRQKTVALLDDECGLIGPCCQNELSSHPGDRLPLTAREIHLDYGKACKCELCDARLLDDLGLPLETLEV